MMLEAVKLALAVTANEYDAEIQDLIDSALLDLKTNGVMVDNLTEDKLLMQAVKTYVRANFQSPADYDRLAKSYDQQKGHLMLAKGYGYQPERTEAGAGGESDGAG